MSLNACDAVRDLIPELVADRRTDQQAAEAAAHLAGCPACAAERALVEAVQRERIAAPRGLERSVLAALAAVPRRRGPRPVGLALAATIVVSIGAGAVLLRSGRSPAPAAPPVGEEPVGPAVVWPAAAEPLLHGSPSLGDLSVEELETLLEEWES